MKSHISILASDSIGIIFEYLTTKNQIAVSRVCTSWYHIVYHTIHSVVFNALDFEAKQNFDPHQITNILLRYTVLYELNIPQAIRVQDDHMEPIFEKFKNSLQKVSIHASDLTNPRFQCPNLKSLKITKDTHLSNIRFEDCINLEEISFNSTAILESQVQIFMKDIVTSNAPLKSLTLSNCKNLRNLQLPSLKTLQLLDIQTTQVFDSVVVGLLASLENLRHLNLSNCPGLKNVQLTNHKHLETIKLIRCKNIFNVKIEQCPQLKSINLDYSPIISDKLHLLIASNPHVEEWHLAYCKIADYHGSSEESSRLTLSTRLYDLSYSEITDNAVSVYVASSPQLERLLLFYTRVSEPVIFSFSLKELDLTMAFVNNEFVSQIGENCPNLEILSLEYCSSITDISRLASKSLRVLNAARLAIDDQSVTTTLAGCPNLKHLNISGCNNLSKLTINHQNLETIWLSLCRHLTVLYFRDCHSLQQIDIKDSIRLVDLQITCTPFLKKIYVGPPPSNRHLLNLLYEKKIVVQNIDMSAKR